MAEKNNKVVVPNTTSPSETIPTYTNEQAININFVSGTLHTFQKIENNAGNDYDASKHRLQELIANKNQIGRGVGMLIASEAENAQNALNTQIKALEKKFQVQKFMSETATKQILQENGGVDTGDINALARNMIGIIAANNPDMKQVRNVNQSITGAIKNPIPTKDLSNRINELEKSNQLTFNENELAIRFEDQQIEYVVVKSPNGLAFQALINGKIEPNYPANRMPSISNIVIEDNIAIDTKTRTTYKLM